jgi:hypothetical protein
VGDCSGGKREEVEKRRSVELAVGVRRGSETKSWDVDVDTAFETSRDSEEEDVGGAVLGGLGLNVCREDCA